MSVSSTGVERRKDRCHSTTRRTPPPLRTCCSIAVCIRIHYWRTTGVMEMVVRELGPERVVYGSDVGGRSFASQLSKVMGADIPDSARELVLGGNLRRLFTPALRAKGCQ